jgi:hypothetical protein
MVLVATGAAYLRAGDEARAHPLPAPVHIESTESDPTSVPRDTANELLQAAVAADIQRTAALVAGDTRALDLICGDELVFGHADGSIQSKSALLASLEAGERRYFAINPGPREVRLLAEAVALVFGSAELLVGTAESSQPLKIRYLAVYRFDARLGWRLTAYQSARRTGAE